MTQSDKKKQRLHELVFGRNDFNMRNHLGKKMEIDDSLVRHLALQSHSPQKSAINDYFDELYDVHSSQNEGKEKYLIAKQTRSKASVLAIDEEHKDLKLPSRFRRVGVFTISLMLLILGLCGIFSPVKQAMTSAFRSVMSQPQTVTRYETKNIEDLTVGLVIPAHNPLGVEDDVLNYERPNERTWRKLNLISPKNNGTFSEITLLRPLWWLEKQQAQIGGEVWVEVPECGISGLAKLLSIEPCPLIENKEGHVITGTFKHVADRIIDIWIEGEPNPIGCTPNHPFWCEDVNNFVPVGQLQVGSKLRLLNNSIVNVLQIKEREKHNQYVYNIEVHSQHTYYVGMNGVLVHNTRPCNNGNGAVHGGSEHNSAIDNHITKLKNNPQVINIRKNQRQVDVVGTKYKGNNRPDIQYDFKKPNGEIIHVNIEYDHNVNNSIKHKNKIMQNDPVSVVVTRLLQ